MNHPPPRTQGFTLIEILVGLGLLIALVAGVVTVLPRGTQAARASTLAAGSNQALTRTGEQLALDIASGQSIIQQATRSRLDLLKVQKKLAFEMPPGSRTAGVSEVTTTHTEFDGLVGRDVVLANTSGDYLVTRVQSSTAVSGGKRRVAFQCPIYLPGNVAAYTFRPLALAFADATGESASSHATSLYRRTGAWSPVDSGLTDVRFAPVYGRSTGDFGTTLATPAGRDGSQDLTAINYALTSTGERRVKTAGTATLRLLATTPWACGTGPGLPARNNGKLQINVLLDGQRPSGAAGTPSVDALGPGLTTSLNTFAVRAFENLAPGLYNVSASSFTYGGDTYDATVTGSPATVGNGRDATVNVNYTIRKGTAVVTVSGLPNGVTAPVTIGGPDPKSLNLPNGTHRVDLKPGAYTASAISVSGMDPTVTPNSFTVRSGQDQAVNITYAYPNGDVQVRVSGLPTGGRGNIRIRGPSDQDLNLANGTTTYSLPRGTYTVTADNISGYDASVSPGSFVLNPRGNQTVAVTYSPTTGTLRVNVSGLPSGRSTAVAWSGPESGSRSSGNGIFTLTLPAGSYTLNASTVDGYNASPVSVFVPAGSVADANLSFNAPPPPPTGTIRVVVQGLPSGASTTANWTGAMTGSRGSGNGTFTLTNMTPGTYTFSGTPVSGYSASPVSITLNAYDTVELGLTFAAAPTPPAPSPTTGNLTITVQGLPAGVQTLAMWVGPDRGSRDTGNGTITVTGLAPGQYTIAGLAVSGYTAPNVDVTVPFGGTASATLNFTGGTTPPPPPAPSLGRLTINVQGLAAGLSTTASWSGSASGSRSMGNGSVTIDNLPAGSYTVAGTAASGYTAPSVTVNVPAGGAATATLMFTAPATPRTSTLVIHISGLPDTTATTARWSGPQSGAQAATGYDAITLPNVASGTYTITGDPTGRYTAPPVTVNVPGGETTHAFLQFTSSTLKAPGNIRFHVSGLPAGQEARITFAMIGSFNGATVVMGNGTRLVENVQPGSYAMRAQPVGAYGAAVQWIRVVSGQTVDVYIRYSTMSRLVINVQGMPSGDSARIAWAGPTAGNQVVGNGEISMEVNPGTYRVSGDASSQGYTTSGTSVTMNAGETKRVTLSYAVPSAPRNQRVTYYANAQGVPLSVDEWLALPHTERYYVTNDDPQCYGSSCPSPQRYYNDVIVTEPPCVRTGDCVVDP